METKTRHFSRYEIDLLNYAITQIEHIEKIVPLIQRFRQ